MKDVKKSSRAWAKKYKVGGIKLFMESDPVKHPIFIVLDPDGWDRKNWEESIEEPITLSDFLNRITHSSLTNVRGFLDMIKTINK